MEKILLYTAGKLIFLMRHEIAVLYCQLLTNIVWIWLENIAVVICIFNPEKWSLTDLNKWWTVISKHVLKTTKKIQKIVWHFWKVAFFGYPKSGKESKWNLFNPPKALHLPNWATFLSCSNYIWNWKSGTPPSLVL